MKKVSDAFCLALIIFSALLCVYFPFMISQMVYDSLILCGKTVVPSLFFHMVLAKIFSKTDIINRAGRFFPDFIRRALNFDKNLCGCLVFGLVSSLLGEKNGEIQGKKTSDSPKRSSERISRNC